MGPEPSEVARSAYDRNTAKRLERISVNKAILEGAKSDKRLAITADLWNAKPLLLGIPGGAVNLLDGSLSPSRPSDYISQQTSIKPDFDQGCPTWMKFLVEATGGDNAYAEFLQRLAGYSLTGETKEQQLYFLHGNGGNGKSIFLNVLSDCMGSYACSAPMETFTASKYDRHPTELAMLSKARLVTASETDKGRHWHESRIKELTGGDPISARYMRQDFFTYKPQFKIMIAGNHRPRLGVVAYAMKRRIVILPFNHKPAVPDKNLAEKLKHEYPAILGWMVKGAVKWHQTGLTLPATVIEATEEYLGLQDVFARWLEDSCVVNSNEASLFVRTADLFSSWKSYAELHNHLVGSLSDFAEQLSAHGIRSTRTKQVRGYRGIQLRVT